MEQRKLTKQFCSEKRVKSFHFSTDLNDTLITYFRNLLTKFEFDEIKLKFDP